MNIVFIPETMSLNGSSLVLGTVYFDFDGVVFPAANWDDFLDVTARWWVEAVRSYHGRKNATTKLLFMDGPVAIRARSYGERTRIECTDRDVLARDLIEVDTADFVPAVMDHGKRVAEECKRRGFSSTDAQWLCAAFGVR